MAQSASLCIFYLSDHRTRTNTEEDRGFSYYEWSKGRIRARMDSKEEKRDVKCLKGKHRARMNIEDEVKYEELVLEREHRRNRE